MKATLFLQTVILLMAWSAFWAGVLRAAPAAAAEGTLPNDEAIRTAVFKSIPLLEKGAKGSLEQRKQCFNCHNQGLAVMALRTAQSRGFEVDAEHLQQQIQFTADFLKRNQERYREGEGQGGEVDTAGYALWTLDYAGWKPDETTAAVAEYFLLKQNDQEHWEPDAKRPPAEQSYFTSTYVALRGLKVFGVPEQRERIDARAARAHKWLLGTVPSDTEDRVFQLRALALMETPEATLREAACDLVATQHTDGGWSQRSDMTSDAYATGSVLVVLHEAGRLSTSDPSYRRGLRYLISTQQHDGSWHVVSHAKPFQTYFESGYPHGVDQYISMAAAGWSTTALALALPER